MDISSQEKDFLDSIKRKVKEYKIPVTAEQIKSKFSGFLVETKYNDKSKEVVDAEVERFLVQKSYNYFIRKYGVIPLPGTGYVPFNMYYIQEKAVEDFEKNHNVIFLKTRQVGISTVCSLYCLWKMLNEDKLEVINIISKTGKAAYEFKDRMDETLRRLPMFLLPKIKDRTTGEARYVESLRELSHDNKTQLMFPNGSKFNCETASENAGRGDAISLLILDEVAHYRTSSMAEKIWRSASPALSKTKGKAIIISTPNGSAGAGEWYYKKWMESKAGYSGFYPITIDWWEIPDPDKNNISWLNELVAKDYHNNPTFRQEGVERARYEEEHVEQNPWLKKAKEEMGIVTFRQEILHDFIITGESVFSSDKLEIIEKRLKPPIQKDTLGNEVIKGLWIWEKPIPRRNYILSVDSSRGSGRDASGIQVFDPFTYTQVAEYKGYISTKRLGEITKIIARYYNNAYVIIECNNLGEATFNEVYYDKNDPYDNVFRKTSKRAQGGTITIGWDTTPALRILITEDFINFIMNDDLFKLIKIRSERLLAEMKTWIFDGSKPTHAEGMHDDLIMAFCLALYNRNKFDKTNDFILTTSTEVNYRDITPEDIREIREGKKFEDENMDLKELTQKRKEDKFVQQYNIDYFDYSWLLGYTPKNNEQEDEKI